MKSTKPSGMKELHEKDSPANCEERWKTISYFPSGIAAPHHLVALVTRLSPQLQETFKRYQA